MREPPTDEARRSTQALCGAGLPARELFHHCTRGATKAHDSIPWSLSTWFAPAHHDEIEAGYGCRTSAFLSRICSTRPRTLPSVWPARLFHQAVARLPFGSRAKFGCR
jgi:hypothetical protein